MKFSPVFLVVEANKPYITQMVYSNGPVIDMTPDGDFAEPAKPTLGTIISRVIAFGILLLAAAVAFWMALFVIPVLIIMGVVGYFIARPQLRSFGIRRF